MGRDSKRYGMAAARQGGRSGRLWVRSRLFLAKRSLLACLFAHQAHLSLGLGHGSGPSPEGHAPQKQHHSFQVQCDGGQEALYGVAQDAEIATAPQAMPDLRFAELALDLVAFLEALLVLWALVQFLPHRCGWVFLAQAIGVQADGRGDAQGIDPSFSVRDHVVVLDAPGSVGVAGRLAILALAMTLLLPTCNLPHRATTSKS